MNGFKALLGWLMAIPLLGAAVGMFFTSGVHAAFLLLLALIALPPLWRALASMGWTASLGARASLFCAGLVALAVVTVMTEPFGPRAKAYLSGTALAQVAAPAIDPIARATGWDAQPPQQLVDAGPQPPGDPRLAGLPSVGEHGLTPRDVDVLQAAALFCLDELGVSQIASGDKSSVRPDTYYLNFGQTASYAFGEGDIPDLDARIARLER
jgi:hypothetical protein